MIAGIWHPGGVAVARRVLFSLVDAPPSFTLDVEPGSVVATWGHDVTADAPSRSVFTGDVTALPAAPLDAATARRLLGAYGLIAATPGGLVLARGVLGGRPLYHRPLPGGGVVACSEMLPLVRLGEVAVDADALAAYVVWLPPVDPHATVVRPVRRVCSCEVVALGDDGERVHRRELPRLPSEFVRASVEDAAAAVWEAISRSVERALRGRKKAAVQVSGGLDSTAVLVAALDHASVVPMTLEFGGRNDDRPYARALCEHLGVEPVRLRPAIGGPYMRRALVQDGLPYVSAPYDVALLRCARELGADTVLSGAYGDDVFAGNLFALGFELPPWRALSLVARLTLPWDESLRDRVFSYLVVPRIKAHVPPSLIERRAARMHARGFPYAGRRAREVLRARRRENARRLSFGRTPTERYTLFTEDHPWTAIADQRGQLEAESGILCIDPLQDDTLLQLVSTFPTTLHCHDGQHRALVRHALRGRVPERVRLRADKAWFEEAFFEAYEAGGGLDAVADLARATSLDELGVVRAAAVADDVATLRRGGDTLAVAEAWARVMTVVGAEAFVRQLPSLAAQTRGKAPAGVAVS